MLPPLLQEVPKAHPQLAQLSLTTRNSPYDNTLQPIQPANICQKL